MIKKFTKKQAALVGGFLSILILAISIFAIVNQTNAFPKIDVNPALGIPGTTSAFIYSDNVFAFTIDTTLDDTVVSGGSHGNPTNVETVLPYKIMNNNAPENKIWIDWGDGNVELTETPRHQLADNSDTVSLLRHSYPNPGVYDIKILAAEDSATKDDFGGTFNDQQSPYSNEFTRYQITKFDSPLPPNFRKEKTGRFAFLASGMINLENIPVGFLSQIDFNNAQETASMFAGMYMNSMQNSLVASIPSDIFTGLNGSKPNSTRCATYWATFYGAMSSSAVANIPAGIFDHVGTIDCTDSGNTKSNGAFSNTFAESMTNSPVADIPSGIFKNATARPCNTTTCVGLSVATFARTFNNFATNNVNKTLKADWLNASFFAPITGSARIHGNDGTVGCSSFAGTFANWTKVTSGIPSGFFNVFADGAGEIGIGSGGSNWGHMFGLNCVEGGIGFLANYASNSPSAPYTDVNTLLTNGNKLIFSATNAGYSSWRGVFNNAKINGNGSTFFTSANFYRSGCAYSAAVGTNITGATSY